MTDLPVRQRSFGSIAQKDDHPEDSDHHGADDHRSPEEYIAVYQVGEAIFHGTHYRSYQSTRSAPRHRGEIGSRRVVPQRLENTTPSYGLIARKSTEGGAESTVYLPNEAVYPVPATLLLSEPLKDEHPEGCYGYAAQHEGQQPGEYGSAGTICEKVSQGSWGEDEE